MGKRKENIELKKALELYNKDVSEGNKKTWGDFFKEATEGIFKEMDEEVKEIQDSLPSITFENVEYGSGYFIFDFGVNKVVHFNVKEIPGWKFGIWWGEPKLEQDTVSHNPYIRVSYEMFAQYETAINKFKPEASNISTSCDCTFNSEGKWGLTAGLIDKMIFMYKEPELAFCEHWCGWNYNYEYHTRAEAKKEFNTYIKHQNLKDTILPQLDKKVCDVVAENLKELIDKGQAIINEREDFSPKYVILLDSNIFEEEIEPGFYDWDIIFTKAEIKKIKDVLKQCSKIANKNKLWWVEFGVLDKNVNIIEHKRFLDIKKSLLK